MYNNKIKGSILDVKGTKLKILKIVAKLLQKRFIFKPEQLSIEWSPSTTPLKKGLKLNSQEYLLFNFNQFKMVNNKKEINQENEYLIYPVSGKHIKKIINELLQDRVRIPLNYTIYTSSSIEQSLFTFFKKNRAVKHIFNPFNWFFPLQQEIEKKDLLDMDSLDFVLYLHGNSANIKTSSDTLDVLYENNPNLIVMIPDYRDYGKFKHILNYCKKTFLNKMIPNGKNKKDYLKDIENQISGHNLVDENQFLFDCEQFLLTAFVMCNRSLFLEHFPEKESPGWSLNMKDIVEFYHWAVHEKIKLKKIVLYGRSLGTGPTCYLLSKYGFLIKECIMETPYSSIEDMFSLKISKYMGGKRVDRLNLLQFEEDTINKQPQVISLIKRLLSHPSKNNKIMVSNQELIIFVNTLKEHLLNHKEDIFGYHLLHKKIGFYLHDLLSFFNEGGFYFLNNKFSVIRTKKEHGYFYFSCQNELNIQTQSSFNLPLILNQIFALNAEIEDMGLEFKMKSEEWIHMGHLSHLKIIHGEKDELIPIDMSFVLILKIIIDWMQQQYYLAKTLREERKIDINIKLEFKKPLNKKHWKNEETLVTIELKDDEELKKIEFLILHQGLHENLREFKGIKKMLPSFKTDELN